MKIKHLVFNNKIYKVNIDTQNIRIRNVETGQFLSVALSSRNVVSSRQPFTWVLSNNGDGLVRIKSERDDLYLQLNERGNGVVLAVDALRSESSNSSPAPNLTKQQWNLQNIGNNNVLISNDRKNFALAFDRSNAIKVVVTPFTNENDPGINLKSFTFEPILN